MKLDLTIIQVAQKRVLRAMAGKRYWKGLTPLDSCRPLFQQFGILPVFSLYVLECAKFARRHPEKFVKNSEVEEPQGQNTRNTQIKSDDLYVTPVTLLSCGQNPLRMVARVYNKLPESVKSVENEEHFVGAVKKLLSEHMFYDLQEFLNVKFDE